MSASITRRELLRYAGLASAAGLLAACQPKVVEVTKVVEKEVEKVVKETIVVEKKSRRSSKRRSSSKRKPLLRPPRPE